MEGERKSERFTRLVICLVSAMLPVRRDDDQGAGLGIGGGLMVLEGNAQVIADIIQFGGINVPGLPGQLHRTAERESRGALTPRSAQHLLEHRPVKGGVMGRQKIDALQHGGQAGP